MKQGILPTSEIIELKSASQWYNLVKNFFHTGIDQMQPNMK